MDIPMLVGEIREQLAGLDVTAYIEAVARGRGQDALADLQLSEISVRSLPLRLPLLISDAHLEDFRARLGGALGASLAADPVRVVRTTAMHVRIGRKRDPEIRAITCEYAVTGARVTICAEHGWELRGIRFRSLLLPEVGAEFQMVEVRPPG